jgi:hypothetical protein
MEAPNLLLEFEILAKDVHWSGLDWPETSTPASPRSGESIVLILIRERTCADPQQLGLSARSP